MKIKYERSGGFGGLKLTSNVDTDKLEPSLSEKIIAAVKKILPFQGKDEEPKGNDLCSYIFEIEDADGKHTVKTHDGEMTDEIDELKTLIGTATKKKKE